MTECKQFSRFIQTLLLWISWLIYWISVDIFVKLAISSDWKGTSRILNQKFPVGLIQVILPNMLLDHVFHSWILRHSMHMRTHEEWNMKKCSILLRICIPWELLSLWPHIRLHHFRMINFPDCSMLSEIQTYNTTGVPIKRDCYFSLM